MYEYYWEIYQILLLWYCYIPLDEDIRPDQNDDVEPTFITDDSVDDELNDLDFPHPSHHLLSADQVGILNIFFLHLFKRNLIYF